MNLKFYQQISSFECRMIFNNAKCTFYGLKICVCYDVTYKLLFSKKIFFMNAINHCFNLLQKLRRNKHVRVLLSINKFYNV